MTTAALSQPPAPSGLARVVPALGWIRGYRVAHFRGDAVAGVTLAAYLLPAALGDASLARLPPEAGLYACLCAGLVFWCLCSSRQTAITVTSAISLLMGTSLATLAGGDASRFGGLAACTAVLVAAMALAAWLVKAGSLVSFISETVLIGFKTGVALTLASTQFPKLLGISGAHGGFWECSRHLFTHLHEINPVSAAVGGGALALLILGRVFLKHRPVALFIVIGSITFAGIAGLAEHNVQVLGEIPRGLPPLGRPAVRWSDLNDLLPLAMACFLLAAVETVAIGRMFASKTGIRFDANQEFLAMAGANLAAGIGGGFPVGGGMSQSLVNDSAGARTPISGLVAASLILVVAVFFSDSLKNLPQPVLAAVVLMAVASLVRVSALRHFWRTDRSEFLIAMVALAGVLTSGLLRGVLIGAVISIVLLIRRAARPHVATLGRIPGVRRYSDIERHPDNEQVPGVVIFRTEGSIVYFNADHVRDSVLAGVRAAPHPVHTVVYDLSATPVVDLAGGEMLRNLATDLRAMNIHLRLVEARSSVRDRLRAEGL